MIIAITGVGAFCALGTDAPTVFRRLWMGHNGLEGAPTWGERGPVGTRDGGQWRSTSSLADAVCREALGEAPIPEGLALVGATTSADMGPCEESWRRLAEDKGGYFDIWDQLAHAPTARVAWSLGTTGPQLSLSTACTSGACAVGAAADLVRVGRAPAALAFGADALCDTTVHGFASLGLYDPEPCRPFSADRRGLNLGEAGAALLLEPLDAALARGATPIALLAGYGNSSDAHRLTAPEPGGHAAGRAIRQALGKLPADRVGWVCAHATGTPINDEIEAEVLKRELPSAAVTGIKGAVGHTLGAAGALEAVITALAVKTGRMVKHQGADGSAFPGLNLLTRSQNSPLEAAMSVNFAFGGHNTALLFTRYEP